MCSGIPSNWTRSRRRSRVVPGISVTIAASVPASLFIRLDFPAFGSPAITNVMPSRISRPNWALFWIPLSIALMLSKSVLTFSSERKSISSSGKSIAAST